MVDIPTKFTCTLDHTSKNLRWMGVLSIYHIGLYLNFCKLSEFKPTCSLDSPFQKNRNQISVCLTPFAADAFRAISTKENLSIQLCVRTARSTGKFRKRNIWPFQKGNTMQNYRCITLRVIQWECWGSTSICIGLTFFPLFPSRGFSSFPLLVHLYNTILCAFCQQFCENFCEKNCAV